MDKQSAQERQGHWRAVVGRWRDSGLSKAAFCRENDLRLWQFYYWVKRVAELDGEAGQGFARVAAARSGLCLRFGAGVRVELDPDFDEATLRRLLEVLAGAC